MCGGGSTLAAALNRLYCAVLEYSSHILARWCGLFGSGVAGASRVWLQPLWQTGQPAPEDETADETARGGKEPPHKKTRRSKKGGKSSDEKQTTARRGEEAGAEAGLGSS